jgi:gamma-glutamyl hydrolase
VLQINVATAENKCSLLQKKKNLFYFKKMKLLSTIFIFVTLFFVLFSLNNNLAHAQNGAGFYSSNQPDQPIVGILSQPNPHSWANECGEYVQTTYTHWLASAGVRSVVIHYNTPQDQLLQQLSQLNGALFTGGGLDFKAHPTFYATAKAIYNYAVQTATQTPNNKFVLWGTCQGHQVIQTIAAGDDFSILHCDYKGVDNAMLPLQMTDKAYSSRFFSLVNTSNSPATLWEDMTTKNSTANAHECGISPSLYTSNAKLAASLNLLSTNVDINGLPFSTTVEHKFAEIYSFQNHYEIPQTWWISNVNHRPSTIEVSRYGSSFFASRLRMNNNSFPSLPNDPISGEPVYKNTNNWLTTMLNTFPVVQSDPMGFSGFHCVGGYNPATTDNEQQLQNEISNLKSQKASLNNALLACIVLGTLGYWWQKGKQERREAALGLSPRHNNGINYNSAV